VALPPLSIWLSFPPPFSHSRVIEGFFLEPKPPFFRFDLNRWEIRSICNSNLLVWHAPALPPSGPAASSCWCPFPPPFRNAKRDFSGPCPSLSGELKNYPMLVTRIFAHPSRFNLGSILPLLPLLRNFLPMSSFEAERRAACFAYHPLPFGAEQDSRPRVAEKAFFSVITFPLRSTAVRRRYSSSFVLFSAALGPSRFCRTCGLVDFTLPLHLAPIPFPLFPGSFFFLLNTSSPALVPDLSSLRPFPHAIEWISSSLDLLKKDAFFLYGSSSLFPF